MRKVIDKSRSAVLALGTRWLRWRGYAPYAAPRMAHSLLNDLLHTRGIGLRRKWWAYRHGFLSASIAEYGLTSDNYGGYVPDLDYFRWFPINNGYRKWIDDKLTTRHVLAPFVKHLPRYYYHLLGNRVFRLMDCPAEFPVNVAGVIQLLDRERHLAVKPEAGTHGTGFHKVSAVDGANLLNDQPIGRDELVRFLSSCTRHLVTEYVVAHSDLRRIYPHSPNALRVMIIHDSSEGPQIVGAFLRFGTSKTGVIDNASAGGVFCGVDLEDGRFIDPRRCEAGKFVSAPTHPDTGVAIEGRVPFWTEIRQTLSEMAMHMPQLVYMGFDVLITDTGFKVIEINSHPGLTRMQQYYPLLKDPRSRRFFTSLARAGNATGNL